MRKGYSENKEKPLSRVRVLRGPLAPSCSLLGDRPQQSGRAAQALTGLRCTRCLCDRSSCGCDPALPPGPAWPSLGAGKTGHPPLPVPPGSHLLAWGVSAAAPTLPWATSRTQGLLLPCWQVRPAAASRDQSKTPHGL